MYTVVTNLMILSINVQCFIIKLTTEGNEVFHRKIGKRNITG